MKEGGPSRDLLDLTRIEDLKGISRTPAGWRIGATTRWSEIVAEPLPTMFDGLKAAAREVGSIQIQNSGTIAGNLCNASPAADGVPPLLTLNAMVEISARSGTRTIALSDFITGVRKTALAPGELVSAIHIPALPESTFAAFEKLGSRRYLVISIAMVAACVTLGKGDVIETVRVAVGACSPVARRLPALEDELKGSSVQILKNPELVTATHLESLNPIDDVRGSATYRVEVVAELCRRALLAAATEGSRDE